MKEAESERASYLLMIISLDCLIHPLLFANTFCAISRINANSMHTSKSLHCTLPVLLWSESEYPTAITLGFDSPFEVFVMVQSARERKGGFDSHPSTKNRQFMIDYVVYFPVSWKQVPTALTPASDLSSDESITDQLVWDAQVDRLCVPRRASVLCCCQPWQYLRLLPSDNGVCPRKWVSLIAGFIASSIGGVVMIAGRCLGLEINIQ